MFRLSLTTVSSTDIYIVFFIIDESFGVEHSGNTVLITNCHLVSSFWFTITFTAAPATPIVVNRFQFSVISFSSISQHLRVIPSPFRLVVIENLNFLFCFVLILVFLLKITPRSINYAVSSLLRVFQEH